MSSQTNAGDARAGTRNEDHMRRTAPKLNAYRGPTAYGGYTSREYTDQGTNLCHELSFVSVSSIEGVIFGYVIIRYLIAIAPRATDIRNVTEFAKKM